VPSQMTKTVSILKFDLHFSTFHLRIAQKTRSIYRVEWPINEVAGCLDSVGVQLGTTSSMHGGIFESQPAGTCLQTW
jgi:hypothetical protein